MRKRALLIGLIGSLLLAVGVHRATAPGNGTLRARLALGNVCNGEQPTACHSLQRGTARVLVMCGLHEDRWTGCAQSGVARLGEPVAVSLSKGTYRLAIAIGGNGAMLTDRGLRPLQIRAGKTTDAGVLRPYR